MGRLGARGLVDWVQSGVAFGVLVGTLVFTPFANLFGLSDYERSHGKWPDLLIAFVILVVGKALYLRQAESNDRCQL